MPNTPLSAQQQEALSKIMATPTKSVTPSDTPSYQVPTLGTPAENPTAQKTTMPPAVITVVGTGKSAPPIKSKSMLPFLFLIFGVIILGAYAFFWLKFFKLI